MIRIREATTLALTKLRTRKIRLIVTIIISGLLFSILAGASITARGVFGSINDFSEEGFSKRYIAQGSMHVGSPFMDESIIERALVIHKDTIARKKKEAKRLGVEYNEASEPSPVQEYPNPDGSKMRNLDFMHPAAKQAMREHAAAHPAVSLADLKQLGQKYDATAYYESRYITFDMQNGRLQVLKGGQESFEQQDGKQGSWGPPTGLDSFTSSWRLMSSSLLEPFVLPGQNLRQGADGSIPMIIPLSAAEQLLKLKTLPASASSEDRLERIKHVRQQAASVTFGACFRNGASNSLLQEAISVQKEIQKNKNNKDYKKPDLQYGLPTEACGDVPVVRDVRTKDQKVRDAKQQEFDRIFGEQAPEQTKLAFRVVGIVPDPDYGSAFSVSQIVQSMLTSSLGSGWFAPLEIATQDPTVNSFFPATADPGSGSIPTYFAEFANAEQAKAFIDKEGCMPDYSKASPDGPDPIKECLDAGKPFGLGPYGSNSLGLEDAKRSFGKIFSLAGLGIAFVASIIMMGTVGKMIADSRRETAVFRAIGAKKLDIAQIYLLYTLFISALITAFAVAAGAIAAAWANSRWSAELTQHAIVTYNAQDLERVFKLYAFDPTDMLYLLAVAVAAGLLSALFPLFRSLRRNPIRDMRDDT